MSAIYGIFYFHADGVDNNDIALMTESTACRNRRSVSIRRDQTAFLARENPDALSESDGETFPFADVGGNLKIVADARLDNRTELFQKLEISNAVEKDFADERLILAAYRKWGDECVERLLGNFAFAIWDKRQRQIFLARDHLGAKSLFYYSDAKKFVFASQPKAILAATGIESRVNKNKLAAFALPQSKSLFWEEAWFENIVPVVAGTCLTVDAKGVRKRRYWEPQLEKKLPFKREDEILEAFQSLMFEVVGSNLRDDFPVMALLSGGLDSSAIVSVAAKILEKQNRQLQTLSAVLPAASGETLEDESYFINQFQTFPNVSINYITAPEKGPFDDVEKLVWEYDTPQITSRHYLYTAFSEHARKNGSRVILDGGGGEYGATFDGAGCYAEMFLRLRWLGLQRELALREKTSGESFKYNLRANVMHPFLPDFLRRQKHRLTQDNFLPAEGCPLQDSFAADLINLVKSKTDSINTAYQISPFHRVNQHKLIGNLQRKSSALSSGGDIEYPFPLLDKRLLEFCLAAPCSVKVKNGYQRYLIRAGLDKILPPAIQWRTSKGAFSPDYFRRYNAQRAQVTNFLSDIAANDPIRHVVDVEKIKEWARLPVSEDEQNSFAARVARDFVPDAVYLIYFLRRFSDFQN
jgi:asparagine synthase (glutamine-hydrolysing)